MKTILTSLLVLSAASLTGCGNRTIRLDFVPVEDRLTPVVLEASDAPWFTSDKIAMVTVSGTISNGRSSGLLATGSNPVSDFRETLDAIARDEQVKAVVLRINSPGGTVTASAMMYQDLLDFKKKTGKPVVTCMMDLCASGGYYLSCASDYRIAYPSTITGSIGVIMQTVNINNTLHKIGVGLEAVKSKDNKDMGSPFKPASSDLDRPLTETDRKLIQSIVDQFYATFVEVVKASPNHVDENNWTLLTDGRILTGKDAKDYGLIDQVGSLNDAFAKAKAMARIDHAKIIAYKRSDDDTGSVYASTPLSANAQQVNLLNLNVELGDLIPNGRSQFLYMWTGGSGNE